ncbi:MAG: hypothetical protein JW944_15270 [Deltaproteobacteria bacterium]|nr:hypothetical protein [Deltaproteobacteria bacterium]
MKIRYPLSILIVALLFAFGCAAPPQKIIVPPETPREEVMIPSPAPEPQPPPAPLEEPETIEGPEAPAAPPDETPMPRSTVPDTVKTDKTASRAMASLRLTEQARLMIESKKPDEAIGVLEKAMNIDPGNGQNYYYLSEAWLMKGNRPQALEFNSMADIYLGNDDTWKARVRRQKARIEKMD